MERILQDTHPINPDPHTDYCNAQRLVTRHGSDLRYCADWKGWLIWDGRRWAPDQTGEAVRRAKDTVLHLWRLGTELEPGDRQEQAKLLRFIRHSQSLLGIKALLGL